MRIVVKKPGSAPTIEESPARLADLQAIVGGYIETAFLIGRSGVVAYCNEDGVALRLPVNIRTILGPIVVVAVDGDGDTVGLTDSQIADAMFALAPTSNRQRAVPL